MTLHDGPPERTVPDPALTLMEAVHVMGGLRHLIELKGPNAVYEAAWAKVQQSARAYAQEHPEEYDKVEASIEMQRRLAGG